MRDFQSIVNEIDKKFTILFTFFLGMNLFILTVLPRNWKQRFWMKTKKVSISKSCTEKMSQKTRLQVQPVSIPQQRPTGLSLSGKHRI